MSQRPSSTLTSNLEPRRQRRVMWTRPVAMLAAGAAALAGMVLAQGLTAAQQASAAAVPPTVEDSSITAAPISHPGDSPALANGKSYYQVDVVARGWRPGGTEPEPSGPIWVHWSVRGLEGQPAGAAFLGYDAAYLDENRGRPGLAGYLSEGGEESYFVGARQPGRYLVEVYEEISDGSHVRPADDPFATVELYFAPPVPSPANSWVEAQWGYPNYSSLRVQLNDAEGVPVSGEELNLSVAAAETDRYGGEDLEFSNDGVFECVIGWGYCEPGQYKLETQSDRQGQRQVEVTWGAPGPNQFKLVTYHDPDITTVTLEFLIEWSLERSTLVVSPSDVEDDPNDPTHDPVGVPLPIPVGADYQITYTAWDARRDNRITNSERDLMLGLYGDDCHAMFRNGSSSLVYTPGPDGRITVQATAFEAGSCRLDVQGQEPRTLVWFDEDLNTNVSRSWYSLTPDAVIANGEDEGVIEVKLEGLTGTPLTQAAALIEVLVPPDSQMEVGEFAHMGAGRYLATFTGTQAGSFPIGVTVDGTPLNVQPRVGNGTALLVEPGSQPSHKSTVTITELDGQLANHDAPSASVRNWGRQIVRATLVDENGEPVVYGAHSLVAAAAPGDYLGGIGLYFGNDGFFACEEVPVDGACLSGVYALPVYSSKAGERQLAVTYLPGAAEEVLLVNGDQPTSRILRAMFATPPASAAYSTLTVSPSVPTDDPDDPNDTPDGVPETLS
ncbi:MAG: Ig-like domain-containing protein, partial [Bifidobacteriaceae bacterium]|nr:Ig-like domain-containing protein [Bifidobacteriaceae bacterium]